jgi:hypothetical protein
LYETNHTDKERIRETSRHQGNLISILPKITSDIRTDGHTDTQTDSIIIS